MKNLRPYPNPSIDIYTEALSRKESEELKGRLLPFANSIGLSYGEYQMAYLNNNLQTIVNNAEYLPVATDLQSLYDFKSKVIKDVKRAINEQQIFKITTTCQNCTINSVSSLDHILGQAQFPEFAVNPLNLFPSCTECNGYKGRFFMHGEHRRFLNLYLDNLPPQQYLFADVTVVKGDIDFTFSIRNINGINPDIFQIIKNHYDFLHLCDRMKLRASESIVSELVTNIKNSRRHLPMQTIIDDTVRMAQLHMLAYGYNHFKYILEIALVQNKNFMSQF